MALRILCALLTLSVATSACRRSQPPAASAEEPEALSVTRWTDRTELFAEYPSLVTGHTSRFAIHLTRLDTFTPLTEGRVDVRLDGGSGPPQTFSVDGPSRPGIFGVDVKPSQSGRRQLVIVLRASGLVDEHRVGEVDVFPTAEAAREAAPAGGNEAPGISFLKEQQWALDFGTAVVAERRVRESIPVPGRIEARPGGAADVVAPIDGRLTRVVDAPPGARVSRGQELAQLAPLPANGGELPQLERARAEAQSALQLSTRDRERAERLTAAGAAPTKRLDEARAAEDQARARLVAAEKSWAQFSAARGGDTRGIDGAFVVLAPVSGVLAAREATPGANVRAGSRLFTVVDAAQVLVVGRASENEAAELRAVHAAEMEVAGEAQRRPAGYLVSMGRVLDPQSRTLPVTFAFDNSKAVLPIGQTVTLHLLMDPAPPRPAVPATAIVDDAGRPIVFVQREGETFERRAVTLGPRSGDFVQVLDGVGPGERIVSKGAYLVRLASLSTSVPAHGHVH